MRKIALRAYGIGVIASASLVLSAVAQDALWEAPGGHFSLDFRSFGWTELSPSGDTGDVLGIEHRGFQAAGAMRTCFITERRAPVPRRAPQQRLNEMATRTTGEFDQTGPPRTLNRINVDGVLVTDAVYDRPIYQHMRWFYISDGTAVIQFHINCGASGNVPEEVSANIADMLQTLRFRARE